MKGFHDRAVASKWCSKSITDTSNRSLASDSLESESSNLKSSKDCLWSSFFASAFTVFESYSDSSGCEKKTVLTRNNGWTSAVKKFLGSGSMRRIQERVLGPNKKGIPSATSDIWLLGVCYQISHDGSSEDAASSSGLAAFTHDFSSRILMTYRKGFSAIGDSKYTSDVGWGCMLRSSQMLVAQALLFHRLGRSWRKPLQKPLDPEYVEILHLFSDSEASAFSIHELLQAGKAYGLAAGSWVGPYAMCRSWESLVRTKAEETNLGNQSFPMAVYVVSGDEDGERGGAPIVFIDDASRHCLEFSKGQSAWAPLLLLVPLVLGLETINPRYIPSLQATFTFPQSLGLVGGKPGASTYIVGVQDDNALFLDPHEVQQALNIGRDVEVDSSSYHSDIIRHIPLNSIDPSLAIGFYCREKGDFEEFCSLATKLANDSDGAPLFTVAHSHKVSKPVSHGDMLNSGNGQEDALHGTMSINDAEGCTNEDDWQLL